MNGLVPLHKNKCAAPDQENSAFECNGTNHSAVAEERKRFATLQAQAASCGFVVATADDARGERVILASPWGECRVFRSVRELATFVEGLGGAR